MPLKDEAIDSTLQKINLGMIEGPHQGLSK